MFQFNYRVESF